MMGTVEGIDYWKMAAELDVASWDSYPLYHDRDDTIKLAATIAMAHDMYRSMKGGRPFMLMESCPSAPNWPPIGKLKKPGVHKLASLQAVAHGADTVQYFQWRKNRGSFEKFHGAVVDHVGHEQTRIFREVADVGQTLEKLRDVIGTTVPAQAALIHDWENRWSLEGAGGPRHDKKYMPTCEAHYQALWEMGVPTDVINEDQPLDRYKLVIAPMLYMIRPGVAERLERFVKTGGTLVTTFLSGISNESDLCFLGGWPGPLRPLLGIWAEELDVLYDDERRTIVSSELGASYGLHGTYAADTFCDLIHAESAQVLATYSDGFYAGRPAATVNLVERGKAIYLAARGEQRMLGDLYRKLVVDLKIERAIDAELPEGVTAQVRQGNDQRFVFLLNFSRKPQEIRLPGAGYVDAISGETMVGSVKLPADGVIVLRTGIGG
jgi:beta-galactosidase